MEYNKWIRLDNASNIFLAARNEIDTKVFRLTVEMKDIVEPSLLQSALNHTYEEYPLFHSTLRRGFFWYYLQRSEVNPRIKLETETPVSAIYKSGEHDFLFRVLYKENRIHLEVFHALTDGTGALWFLEDLVTEYVRLRYAEQEDGEVKEKREKSDIEDSFNRYFKEKKKITQFDRFIKPLREIYQGQRQTGSSLPEMTDTSTDSKVYQVKGTLNPDHRPRIIHLSMSVKEALKLARKEGVSLTIYTTALYILSVFQAKEDKSEETTISVSIPINLRQFFPSMTVRNFFSTTSVDYTFEAGERADLSAICQKIDQQFKKQLEKDALKDQLKKHIEFEFHPAARILLRPLKDLILKGFNKLNNRKISVAMSNLGIINLPEEMSDHVENAYFYTSAIRPQFCVLSYNQTLNICFTSPFMETDIFQYFVKYLTDAGLAVTVDANKVTKEELENQ
jgi:NRPS condensation-like uncharacterized protein